MSQNTIIFTVKAAPREGGEQIFRTSIDRIVASGVGGAVFNVVEVTDSSAVLRGEMVTDARMATDHGLAEYLDDALVSKEGIKLDLDAQITTRNPSESRRGGTQTSQ